MNDDDKKLPAIQNRLISAAVEIDQDGVHLELAKNPTILFNILNNKAIDSRIPYE